MCPRLSNRLDKSKFNEFSKQIYLGWHTYGMSLKNKDCIDLSHGDPMYGPPSNLKAAIKAIADKLHCYDETNTAENIQIGDSAIILNKYRPTTLTHPDLCQAGIEDFHRIGIPVSDEYNDSIHDKNIIAGAGVTQLWGSAILAMVDMGGKILLPLPTYSIIQWALDAIDQSIEIIPIHTDEHNDYKVTAEQLEKALADNPDTQCLFYVNPNNPTGGIYTRSEYEAHAKVLLKYPKIWVIEDCVYDRVFLDNNAKKDFIPFAAIQIDGHDMNQRTFTIKGLAKSHGLTALRIGYGTSSNNELLHKIRRMILSYTFAASEITQTIAAAALQNTPQSYFDAISEKYVINREIVIKHANDLNAEINSILETSNITYVWAYRPKAGFFTFYAFPGLIAMQTPENDILSDLKLSEYLVEKHAVFMIHGAAHGFATNEMKLRLTISTETNILRKGLQRIREGVLDIIKHHRSKMQDFVYPLDLSVPPA